MTLAGLFDRLQRGNLVASKRLTGMAIAAFAAPFFFEREQRSQLAVIGQGLPAGSAHDAQRFRSGITLSYQHGAGHEWPAADAVLTMQEGPTAIGDVFQDPVDA